LWNYFVEVSNGDLDTFAQALTEGVPWDAFQGIKAESRKRFSPFRQAVEKHAPTVTSGRTATVTAPGESSYFEEPPVTNDEINVEDIPY
jgi:hypothetical protein